jgi:hypothetical protein
VLNNLNRWIRANLPDRNGNLDKPILMIDDEADNASVNTSEDSPTKINSLIRKILKQFDRSAYVGYTATPFANIFISPDENNSELGSDLFPESFIVNLHAPGNYIGPTRVFGLSPVPDSEMEEVASLPIIRQVNDNETFIPSGHKKDHVVPELPHSLRQAIRSFVLSCAARAARGQGDKHCSMLIHVTRFNAVQHAVAELTSIELRDIRKRLVFGDGARTPSILDELKDLWERDFVPTTRETSAMLGDGALSPIEWARIEHELKGSVSKIQVKTVNGKAGDILDYFGNPDGISVIAIGGDKLSRGLTLEGLTVSYYLRASRMYDTLMQMGRWFGYRPGYVDLCRLYTSTELQEWYQHITLASEELRLEFDRMASAGMTPLQYGLRVKSHPGVLTITSAGKMRSGRAVKVSFAGRLVESFLLSKKDEDIGHNFEATASFLRGLAIDPERRSEGHVWSQVPGTSVADFFYSLCGLKDHRESSGAEPQKIGDYIAKKLDRGELTEWTVILIDRSGETGNARNIFGFDNVHLTPRKPDERRNAGNPELYHLTRSHVITEADEWLDLTEAEYEDAKRKRIAQWEEKRSTEKRPSKPSGPFVRAERPKKRGLLLLYALDPAYEKDGVAVFETDDPRRTGYPIVAFAASFPETDEPNDSVEYVVNSVYYREEEAYELGSS